MTRSCCIVPGSPRRRRSSPGSAPTCRARPTSERSKLRTPNSELRTGGLALGQDAATLLVRVMPRAGRTVAAGWRGGALLVRLAAAPVDGAANEALIAFLADAIGCPRRSISIARGEKSRDKHVRVEGLEIAELQRRLARLTSGPQA